MKDYKAIFRDSVGSGKHGKWLKNPYMESHGLFKCFWKQDFFGGGGGGLIFGESWSVCPSTLSVMFLSVSYRVLLCSIKFFL